MNKKTNISNRIKGEATKTFHFLMYMSTFGGILIFMLWFIKDGIRVAWPHSEEYFVYAVVCYAIYSILKRLDKISTHLEKSEETMDNESDN